MKIHIVTIFTRPEGASQVLQQKAVFQSEAKAFEVFNKAAMCIGSYAPEPHEIPGMVSPWIINGEGGGMAGLPGPCKIAIDPARIVGVICESPEVQIVQGGQPLVMPGLQ